jgi:putative phosphoribosyl transferase
MIFDDRAAAGKHLAEKLAHLKDEKPVVLALPRGGVPIGYEIAHALDAPLDLLLVRKIGAPWQPELALGAVADGDKPDIFIDEKLAKLLKVSDEYIEQETKRQVEELERRRRLYCAGRRPVEITGATPIVVDDGIATGATMRVALHAARRRHPARLVLATPVAAEDTIAALRALADEVVCLEAPADLGAIGFHYADFHQLSDDEVTALLSRAAPGDRSPTAER